MTTLSEEQSIEDVRVAPIDEGSAFTGLWNAVAILGGMILLKWAAEWVCGVLGVGR